MWDARHPKSDFRYEVKAEASTVYIPLGNKVGFRLGVDSWAMITRTLIARRWGLMKLNWEAIGAIAESLGVIGVIRTLGRAEG